MKRLILVLVIIVFGSSIAYLSINKDDSFQKIQEKGTIRIGYSIEAPYAFLNDKGEVTGLSPEVAKYIANKLDIKNIEWRLYEFGSLITALELNEIDIIASGMFITKERAKRISFSEPTFKVTQGLLVIKGNPKKLNSYEQALNRKGVKIAVLAGSIENEMLEKIGFNESNLVSVPDVTSGKAAVESGITDALALSAPTLNWMIKNDKFEKVQLASPFYQLKRSAYNNKMGYGAIEFRKNDLQLKIAWNKELEKFIGSEAHKNLLKKFGFPQTSFPDNLSTIEILN